MSKDPEELYKEREQRYYDAVSLKEPDRVPLAPGCMFWPALYHGLSFRDAMYDHEKTAEAWKKTVLEFDWDMVPSFTNIFPGPLFEAVDLKVFKWPGYNLPDNIPFQFVEEEYMKADEYDELFADPSGYLIRKTLPRAMGAAEYFGTIPEIPSLYGAALIFILPTLALSPDLQKAIDCLREAGMKFLEWMGVASKLEAELKTLGYPMFVGAPILAPFDVVSDLMRGMRGSMLDMYRQPENLLKLIDMLTQHQIDFALTTAQATGSQHAFIPLHRGAAGFMSNKQFETFYWPSLKRLINDLIRAELIPMIFFEGDYTPRLDYLKELPKGKTIAWMDKADIFKAKEEIGDRICLKGNIPPSLFVAGTPAQMEEYCKKLIDVVGEGGGYMIDGAVNGICDEARPENVKVMTEVTKTYGVYRK